MDEPLNPDIDPTDNLPPGQGVLPFDEVLEPQLTEETRQATPNEPDAEVDTADQPDADVGTNDQTDADVDTADQPDADVDTDDQPDADVDTDDQPEDEVDRHNDIAAEDEPTFVSEDEAIADTDENAVTDDASDEIDLESDFWNAPTEETPFAFGPSAPSPLPPLEPVEVDVDSLDLSAPESIPALDRPRPFRPPVIPLWVSYVSVALIVAIIAGVGGYLWWSSRSAVTAPIVIGLTEERATDAIESAGLVVDVAERRFSTQPKGQVLEQDPVGGTELKRGDVISLIVSAGSEEFPMPDVVGDHLKEAQSALEDRGLIVNVTTIESGEASDTVLSSVPGPGESVRTGDVVRLTVSKPAPDGGGLKPYSLQGVTVLLDPAPVLNSATDPAMDVSRRLRALLEAAGATVSSTRAASDPPTLTETDRAARAKEASASVAIGLSVAESGAAGRVVLFPGSGRPEVVAGSERLASVLTSGLAQAVPPAASNNAGSDAVLTGTNAAWARIRVGSLTAREDQTAFADPTWADKVARAIYTAIGQLYGLEASQ